ncbi:dihydroxyacetone kinase subunit DhaL [Dictyobacter aurantiacus]|uniref:Dihydroxyacetone kinase subunit L n=1 Tax=Dictyobacter aurantiacus TaxID=1936993 RepID=A0A401ZGA4_9CHLR|nr:dihydroxyacetone kinase subunit DhaL [Dictyobacter aurantiacus]GCE05911.1 dihydroxyacetone kinase subunit L [Dictyobacter aurantiacus]
MPVTHEDILRWLQRSTQVLHENSAYLTQLDSAIGDADHGSNMDRGFTAVSAKLASLSNADIGALLKTVGTTLVSTVGGASGPLYGTAFLRAGMASAGKQSLETPDVIALFDAALEGVKTRGKAQAGEKTMLDALIPAIEAGKQAASDQLPPAQVLQRMAVAAETGMKSTIDMVATKGRASYLGERSAGHQDPGATSCWLILQAFSDILAA